MLARGLKKPATTLAPGDGQARHAAAKVESSQGCCSRHRGLTV